jgi:hypothetical protein
MSLASNISDLATRVATEAKSLRTLINGNEASLAALTTGAKSSLVAAINELKAAVDAVSGSAAGINDGVTSTGSTYSSSKVVELLDALKDELLGAGASAALDTIAELAQALGDNPNAVADILAAQALRVRVDAVQAFTDPQKLQARSNIGAVAATDVGDTSTNFVTTFENGLV